MLDASVLTAWRVHIVICVWGFPGNVRRSVLHATWRLPISGDEWLPLFNKAGALQVPCFSHLPSHRPLGGVCFCKTCFKCCTIRSLSLSTRRMRDPMEPASGLSFTDYQPCDFSLPRFLIHCVVLASAKNYHMPFREVRQERGHKYCCHTPFF